MEGSWPPEPGGLPTTGARGRARDCVEERRRTRILGRRHRSSGASEKVRVERRFRGCSPSAKVMAEARLLRGVSLGGGGCGGDGSSSMLISGRFILAWRDRTLPNFQTLRLGEIVVLLCCCFVVGEEPQRGKERAEGQPGGKKKDKDMQHDTRMQDKTIQYNTRPSKAKQYK